MLKAFERLSAKVIISCLVRKALPVEEQPVERSSDSWDCSPVVEHLPDTHDRVLPSAS